MYVDEPELRCFFFFCWRAFVCVFLWVEYKWNVNIPQYRCSFDSDRRVFTVEIRYVMISLALVHFNLFVALFSPYNLLSYLICHRCGINSLNFFLFAFLDLWLLFCLAVFFLWLPTIKISCVCRRKIMLSLF